MVVLDAASDHALAIFNELYRLKFPFHKIQRIEKYNGDDEASMTDNNSSCFNCRTITGGGLPSLHSYGLAIDINPIQNPYIAPQQIENSKEGIAKVLPSEGLNYLNRAHLRPGMVENDNVKDIFKKHGFTIWGGQWNTPIDWQHFQPSRALAQLLALMSPVDAKAVFEMYTIESKLLNAIDPKKNELLSLYEKNPQQFMELLRTRSDLLTMDPSEAFSIIRKSISPT